MLKVLAKKEKILSKLRQEGRVLKEKCIRNNL